MVAVPPPSDGGSAPVELPAQQQQQQQQQQEEGEPAPEPAVDADPVPGRLVLQVTMPNLNTGPNSSKLRVLKPGKLVSLNTHRFDPSIYNEAEEIDLFTKNATSDDGVRAPMPTKIVRWRAKRGSDGELLKNADGSLVAESNARIVRWSDGSLSLAVGSAPMLHVKNVPVPKDQSYVFVKQMQTQVGSAQ